MSEPTENNTPVPLGMLGPLEPVEPASNDDDVEDGIDQLVAEDKRSLAATVASLLRVIGERSKLDSNDKE